MRIAARAGWMVMVFLPIAGCAPKYFEGRVLQTTFEHSLREIAIIPFESGLSPAGDPGGREELFRAFQSAEVDPEATRVIADLFRDHIKNTGEFTVRAETEVAETLERLQPDLEGRTAMEAAVRVGQALKVDAVLIGSILAYEDRRGGPVAVDRPARVGFVSSLISIPEGQAIWTGKYFERQQSLTENLATLSLFWKRSGRWLTAEELARYAVGQALKTWPPPRDTQHFKEDPPS